MKSRLEKDIARLTTEQLYEMRNRYNNMQSPGPREYTLLDVINNELADRGRSIA